jgi:hypothetical protein
LAKTVKCVPAGDQRRRKISFQEELVSDLKVQGIGFDELFIWT